MKKINDFLEKAHLFKVWVFLYFFLCDIYLFYILWVRFVRRIRN